MSNPEGRVNYIHVSDVPNTVQQRFEYNSDSTVKYAGHAARGQAESADSWVVQFFEYDVSMRVTSITIGIGSWTLRASLSYS